VPESPKTTHKVPKTSLVAWVSYDTGNTIFFTGVMGLVFPLWVTQVMGGDDATVGFTLAASMAVIFAIAPILGAMSDQTGKRMGFLIFFTLLSVVATGLIGTEPLAASLVVFAIGIVAIHTADIFYNTLLEDVSSPNNIGTVAGIGIGLGYIGAILAVGVSMLFTEPFGHIIVIRIIAVAMLILMLPLVTLGRDRPSTGSHQWTSFPHVARASISRLVAATKGVRKDLVWGRFLAARFWYMWAVNAASSFAVLYGVETVGLSEKQVQVIFFLGIVTGIPSAILWGRLVDRYTPSSILKTAVVGH